MERTQIETVICYIEEHLKEELDNHILAQIAGYSEYHFIRLFRKYVHLTPADYIRKRRISEIVRRIGDSKRPISDVAFEYGFNSKENFIRAFRSEHGILPSAWKAANCSLRLYAPFSFDTGDPHPSVSMQYIEGFILRVYRFGEAFPPHCWNRYNAENRSATLSGGAEAEDYGVMQWDHEKKRLLYFIGMKADDAKGDLTDTVALTVEGGLYAVFETQPAAEHDFVQTIRRTWDWIYREWLPESGYQRAPGYEWERYMESGKTYTEKIYVPIRKEKRKMAEIVKVFKEDIPPLRFIGKKYDNFGHWDEWWQNGWFDLLENAMGGTEKILSVWENGGGYIGVERRAEEKPFAYYIGMLTPENTPVPDGFVHLDFQGVSLGTCWLYGEENEVQDTSACRQTLEENGMTIWKDESGAVRSFENCLCPRYTTPDENGKVILDYCYFINP